MAFTSLHTRSHPPPTLHDDPAITPTATNLQTSLNTYTTHLPPTPLQQKYAHAFFHSSPPTLLYTTTSLHALPLHSPHPEVAFLGRSNVGKSSLLNALFGRPKQKHAHVSSKAGRTRTMNGFGVLPPGLSLGAAPKDGTQKEALWKRFPVGGLVVVDMPGYGSGSREEWGRAVVRFIERRRQLRRTFVLVDAEHGLKGSDAEILTYLRRMGVGFSVVLSKVDKVLFARGKVPGEESWGRRVEGLRRLQEEIRGRLDVEAGDGREGAVDILCCSAEKSLGGHEKLGVNELRWAVLTACGMECDEHGQRRKYHANELSMLKDDT